MYSTKRELTDAVISEYKRVVKGQIEQLYYCKAWIFTPDNSEFIILQSYNTIVAAYQRTTRILWVFDHYSNTTTQHVSKFRNWVRYEYRMGRNYPIIVRLYNDSRTSKRAARKNLEDDFASVISTALNQQ
jgi:hypothetical protein